ISAAGKHVIIIGGGDTGADCLGNSHREHPASVTQFELLPEPPPDRPDDKTPWPQWPLMQRTSGAHEEGGERVYSVMTTHLPGVFACGDARRGQSLIVWAIAEGRQAARTADRYLSGLGEEAEPALAAA